MKLPCFSAFLLIMLTTITLPLTAQPWDEYRNHEVMVFTGNSMSKFETAPIGHIFVLAYHEKDNSWQELTLQIDELDNQGYFGTTYNNIVDLTDEFAFMVSEAGDYAPSSSWIDDEDSRQYGRLQFELNNPDDALHKKYVYVYRSSTFAHDPDLPYYYIKYVPASSGASDTVKAMTYLEGHNNKGIPDVWKIADSTGVYGIDILDRQKARANGKYKWYFITYDYKLTENDLIVSKLNYKRGPIRIIRDVTYTAKFSSLDVNVGTFQYRYYPYRVVSLGADKKLESDYGVKLIRQSFDLDSAAIGMKFNNPYNSNVVIDGEFDKVDSTIQPSPVMNWYMYSGNPGTVVMLNEFTPPTNSTYQLYYQESLTGETADGTAETGYDTKSYGDVGILFTGDKMVGGISLPYFTYFLPDSQSQNLGATLAYQTQHPVYNDVTYNLYSPPAEVVITLPDTSAASRYPISISVFIGNVSGLNILSSQLAIQFDQQILQATGVNVVNTLVENWDPPTVTISTDTIFIQMQGTTALQDSGVLVYLNFNVVGTEGQQSPLHFVQARFNTWNPLAQVKDGVFTTLPTPKVSISIPNSYGRPNSDARVPIRIGDVTEYDINRCLIELRFNKNILVATDVFTEGTISSDWTNITFNDSIGAVTIAMNGDSPLQGSGALLWIKFDVMDKLGLNTFITFRNVVFNNGAPLAETKNGRLFVSNPANTDISVSIPDATIRSLDTLRVPVTVTYIAGYELVGYSMDISFDPTVLAFKTIDTTNTINSKWSYPLAHYNSGELSIDNYGDIPLKNDEVLIYLDFEVVGANGSNTTIHFSNMTFNLGSLPAKTHDGTIDVRGVVPVELGSFTATVVNNKVKLDWTTATESNNFGFFIQRTTDLAAEWQTVGFIPGKGTTASPQNYVFIDSEVTASAWYYRLKQQDLDGPVHYSQTIEVNLLPTKFTLYQNYPNPFNSATMIKYELPGGDHHVRLMIYDLLGHQVRTLVDKENQPVGVYQIDWDGRDDNGKTVSSGVYFYRMQAGKQLFIKKMVLIE